MEKDCKGTFQLTGAGGKTGRAFLGFVMMFHSDDYISLFMSFIHIAMRLGSLFQRIASINDRFYLSRLDQLFECVPAIPLSHACIVTDLTPIVTIDRRVRLPLCEAPCGLPRERAGSRFLFLADEGGGFPNQDLSYTLIVADKLQQVPPFDRLRTPLWVGEVQRANT